MKAYVINLDRSKERWAYISKHLGTLNIAYERVSGVEGRKLTPPIQGYSALRYFLWHGKRTELGQVGCFMSHVKASRQFLESGDEHGMILEDDVQLEAGTLALLQQAIAVGGNTWDILRLTGFHGGMPARYRSLDPTHWLAVNLTRKTGTGAYVVNRKAATAIANKLLPMTLPIDHAIERDWLYGYRISTIIPLPASQADTPHSGKSSINEGASNVKYPRVFRVSAGLFRLTTELSRLIYRTCRWVWLKLASH